MKRNQIGMPRCLKHVSMLVHASGVASTARAIEFCFVSSSCGFKQLECVNWQINLRITCRTVGSGPGP